MTLQIAALLLLLAGMVYLFLTEKLPVELTAFLGLLLLVVGGYIPVEEAFSGFSSPAVITMFAIFFVSGALLHTGVADAVGGRIHELVGSREVPLIVFIMLVAGLLSAFMNNVAATAVLLPAVSSIARRAGLAPGRLFMPLSFGAILGGTTTLVGTPPNILAAEMLAKRGLEPFDLFDFTPIGLALLAVGILFMVTVGRRLLPREPTGEQRASRSLSAAYQLHQRLFSIRVPPGSRLDGASLREARIGTALDVNVVAVQRGGRRHLAPNPDFRLRGGDALLAEGDFDDLQELLRVQGVEVEEVSAATLSKASGLVRGVRLRVVEGSGFVGKTLRELRFRARFGVTVVGVARGDGVYRDHLAHLHLQPGDEILALGSHARLEALINQRGFHVVEVGVPPERYLGEELFLMRVPEGSPLAGQTVAATRIGELAGITVIGILHEGETLLERPGEQQIRAGDELVVAGEPRRILDLLELGELQLEPEAADVTLESDDVGLVEAVIAPRSSLAGKNLRELDFRERYGLQVLAIWREARPLYRDLADEELRFGDALLLQGSRDRIEQLSRDEDFLMLTQPSRITRRTEKAPVALAALGLMVVLVVSGLYPIHVAAFAAAVASVLFGALTMEEAYRNVEWKAIFLVAAILPVGVAMETSGTARLIAGLVAASAEAFGVWGFLAVLFVLASLLSQGLDGAPTVVLLAPVVVDVAGRVGVSPYPLMMGVGLAASAAFMTPFSHKSNLLVMSAGGYRSADYLRVGTPLTVLVLILLVVLVPLLFPL